MDILTGSKASPSSPAANIAQNRPNTADNIVKTGIMRKGKKGRKKYIVLREDSYASPACIECYEAEKKFRNNQAPKYVVKLKEVFNINRTMHSRIPHCLGVFDRGETLYIGCDTDEELEAWFYTIFNVYNGTKSGSGEDDSRQNYDYVWDVNVENRGLAAAFRELSGPHRFCLTLQSLYLYSKPYNKTCKEFPLVYISDFGHNDSLFMARVGRSSPTGAGQIFFKTEDPAGAKNIHDVLRTIVDENHEIRRRSSSDASTRRPSAISSSNTLAISNRANSSNPLERPVSSISGFSTGNTLQPHRRSRTISESEKKLKDIRGFLMNVHNKSCGINTDSGSPLVITGDFSRSSASSLSSSGSLSHQSSQRFSRVGSESINPLPVVKESGGSGSGAEYVPVEGNNEPKSDAVSTISSGYTLMNASNASSAPSYHLEEVRSYISDADSYTSSGPLYGRANSLGAKMLPRKDKTRGNSALGATSVMPENYTNLDVDVNQSAEDRKRALSFDSRKQYSRTAGSVLAQKLTDFRLGVDSRCGSVSSTGRRMTDSSRRSNYSEDLVEIDFSQVHSNSTGRSPSNSFSSSDSLGRHRTNSGMLLSATRRRSNDEIQSPSVKFVQQKLLEELNSSQLYNQDYVPMITQDISNLNRVTAGHRVITKAEIVPLPKNVGNYTIMGDTATIDVQSSPSDPSNFPDYSSMSIGNLEPANQLLQTDITDKESNSIRIPNDYVFMDGKKIADAIFKTADLHNQSEYTSLRPEQLSSLPLSPRTLIAGIMPLLNKKSCPPSPSASTRSPTSAYFKSVGHVTPIKEETVTELVVTTAKSLNTLNIADASLQIEPSLQYATLDMGLQQLSSYNNNNKSSPIPSPKVSRSTITQSNNEETIEPVEKVVYAKIQPGGVTTTPMMKH